MYVVLGLLIMLLPTFCRSTEFSHPLVHKRLWRKHTMRQLQLYSPCNDVQIPKRKGGGLPPAAVRTPQNTSEWCYLQEEFSPESLRICRGSNSSVNNSPEEAPYTNLKDCPRIQRVVCGFNIPLNAGGKEPPTTSIKRDVIVSDVNQSRPLEEEELLINDTSPPEPAAFIRSKGKALVLYMMHTWDRDSKLAEWENFAFFWKFGLIPGGHTGNTVLFEGVDFVFYRIHPGVDKVTLCAVHDNIKFMWVPPGPCDLCAHARVLESLGHNELSAVNNSSTFSSQTLKPPESNTTTTFIHWPYKSVVLMNSGVRGPFTHSLSSPWIDIVSIGRPGGLVGGGGSSQSRSQESQSVPLGRSQFFSTLNSPNFDSTNFRTVFAVSMNLMSVNPKLKVENNITLQKLLPHAQSYFLVIPAGLLWAYQATFLDTCTRGGKERKLKRSTAGSAEKVRCILLGESQTLELAKSNQGIVYFSLIRAVVGSDHGTADKIHSDLVIKQGLPLTVFNTNKFYNDPCRSIFVKFGGNVMDRNKMQSRMLQSVNRLTLWMRTSLSHGKSHHDRRLVSDFGFWLRKGGGFNQTKCQWFVEPRDRLIGREIEKSKIIMNTTANFTSVLNSTAPVL